MAKSTAELIAEETAPPKKSTAELIAEETGKKPTSQLIAEETGKKSTSQLIQEELGANQEPEKKGWMQRLAKMFFAPLPSVASTMEKGEQALESVVPRPPSRPMQSQSIFVPEGVAPGLTPPTGQEGISAPTGKGGTVLFSDTPPPPRKLELGDVVWPVAEAVKANTEAMGSPFGVATTPLSIIPGVGPAISAGAKALVGADTALGAGLMGAGRLAGKIGGAIASTERAQKIGQTLKEAAALHTPNLLFKPYYKFVYPKALSMANSIMGKKVIAEQANVVQSMKSVFEDIPPEEAKKVFSAVRDTAEEYHNNLKELHAIAQESPDWEPLMAADIAMPRGNIVETGKEVYREQTGKQMINWMKYVDAKDAAKATPRDLGQFAATLSPEVTRILEENAKAKGMSMLSPESQEFAQKIYNNRRVLKDRIIASGMAPKEAFSETGNLFSPAFYKDQKITLGPLFEHPRVGGRAELERMKPKTFWTSAQRVKRGEVESLAYNVGRAHAQEAFDSIVGEWAQDVAKHPNLAVNMDEFAANPMKYIGWEPITSKGYGVLNGMVVHPSVSAEIKGMSMFGDSLWANFGRFMAKTMGRFKTGVTVWNAPTHFGNNISNPLQVDMLDEKLLSPQRIAESFRQFIGGTSGRYKQTQQMGLVSPEFMRGRMVRKMIDNAYAESEGGLSSPEQAIDNFLYALTHKAEQRSLSELPMRAYQGSEEFWKFHTYRVSVEEGLQEAGTVAGDMKAGMDAAEKAVFNYGEVPIGVREIRSGPLGALVTPFVTYTWKVSPLMMETLLTKPWKFLKWKAFFEAYNAAARQVAGVSDEDWQNYQQAKIDAADGEVAKLMASLQPEMIMPFRGPGGRIMVMQAGRLAPWGQMVDPRGLGLAGPLTQLAFPSYPAPIEPGAPDEMVGMGISPSPRARQIGKIAMTATPLLPGGAMTTKVIQNALSLLPSKRGSLGEAANFPTWVKDLAGVKSYGGTTIAPTPITPAQRISQMTMGALKPVSAQDVRFNSLLKQAAEKSQFVGVARKQAANAIKEALSSPSVY